MKKYFLILVVISSYIIATSGCSWFGSNNQIAPISTDSITLNGSANLHNRKLKNLSINGSARVKEVMVANKTRINGSILAEQSTFGSLQANGAVTMEQSTIKGSASINGSLKAQKSHLQDITISQQSGEILLKKSTSQSITIKRKDNEMKDIVLILDETNVHGDVTFKGSAGKIILRNNAKITGTIINGSIQK